MAETQERSGLAASWAAREVDHLFATLGRYTRFVAYGKWSLSLLVIVIIALVIAWPHLVREKAGLRVSFLAAPSQMAQQAGVSPEMAHPVYDGVDDHGQKYSVTGSVAIQQTPTYIILKDMRSELQRTDGSTIKISADRADYMQDKDLLQLSGNVTVVDQGGYTFTTNAATVETKTSHIWGKDEVTGIGPSGTLLATGFEIKDNGNSIHFGGKDRVNLHLDGGKK